MRCLQSRESLIEYHIYVSLTSYIRIYLVIIRSCKLTTNDLVLKAIGQTNNIRKTSVIPSEICLSDIENDEKKVAKQLDHRQF